MTASLLSKRAEGDALRLSLEAIGRDARAAARQLAQATTDQKNLALHAAAAEIRRRAAEILAANARDVAEARNAAATAAFIDRLALDATRAEAMAAGLEDIAGLADPVGRVLKEWTQPNGLRFQRVSVPLGVIAIIYESRPNVTADAGALALKSGNAAILRGGSESFHSTAAIAACLTAGLVAADLPDSAIQRVPTKDRDAVGHLLKMSEWVDIIVPRGGKSLIARVQEESRIPVIAHLDGLCHTYVDRSADMEKARRIVLNAKMRRTGVCGATETLLIDRAALASHLPAILDDLIAAGCEVRGDAAVQGIDARVKPASEADWATEYLDAIIAVAAVDGVEGAIAHIERWGSDHTDAILAEDESTAERFLAAVDSAIVLWNASTQFADGGEFGFGAEIGISTGRLHARGPVGLEQLTSYKYLVRGTGQIRP
ncbi:MAG: glutamate-5-semialdehyde dehydrogenase [Proteobacteria bacterium]|nr:glutamate-5-semialdehyde dehydrogenase [Pseudomonadota bacterium]MBI3499512.1 glutamate-5-semialdehyde dehydrogenase [Pseudomonadota bacterium]